LLSIAFPPPAIAALLLAMVAVAAIYDVRFRRIPTWLTATGIVLGLGCNIFLHPVWSGLRFSLVGLLLAFAIHFPLYALRAMGGGDGMLMCAIGAMAGWQNWIAIFLITAILGGIAALVLAAKHGRMKKTLWNVGFILTEMKSGRPAYVKNEELDVRSSTGLRLPYGAVIAAGTIVFLAITAR
jgi:prepilin peptidase CpaA